MLKTGFLKPQHILDTAAGYLISITSLFAAYVLVLKIGTLLCVYRSEAALKSDRLIVNSMTLM